MKLLRAYFVDIAGNKMEMNINSYYSKITNHDSELVSSGVAHTVREFEGVRDFSPQQVWLHY